MGSWRPWLWCGLAALSACSLPLGAGETAEDAYYRSVKARVDGNAKARWELLPPTVRAEYDTLAQLLSETHQTVDKHYDPEARSETLASVCRLKPDQITDGKTLYISLLPARGVSSLSTMAELGAFVRSVSIEGDRATVQTWAGDRVILLAHEQRWYLPITSAEQSQLTTLVNKARQNHARTQAYAKRKALWTEKAAGGG